MARRPQQFTIYDVMQAKGVFELNPNNVDAHDNEGKSTYAGPTEYPKMLYHPDGEERVVVPAEIIATPLGPRAVGEQKELLHRIVGSKKEEDELVAKGWHTHPARALSAAGKEAPPMSSGDRIAELEAMLAKKMLELSEAKGQALAEARPQGVIVGKRPTIVDAVASKTD